jgi:hypothetical protein
MDNQEQKFKRIYSKTKVDNFYKKLVKGKGNFLIRFGSECNELIFDNAHNVFATKNKNFDSKLLCLFNMVQTDVKNFLNMNPYIDVPPKVNTAEYNYSYNDEIGTLTATDLDHAFWRIAYVKGYITKKTYEKGSTYKGEFQDGKRHGQGVFTTAKGDRYEGIWENNKLNGHGILIGVNGS